MQPSTAQSTQSPEDIDAVLGRFQAWASSRKTQEVADGVRELSYEDALLSSRYRWHARSESPKTAPVKDVSPAPESVVEKTVAAAIQHPPYPISEEEAFIDEALIDDPFAPDTVILSGVAPEPPAVVPVKAAVPVKTEPAWPPVFGAMLAEALTPAVPPRSHSGGLARIWPASSKPERQVSMSLRVAASEQALIKARAAEAGISASAYLRQCALEVEQLRAQVQHTLAVIERRSTLALSVGEVPVQASPRGFLSRMRRRIFRGKDTPLTLRA